MHNRDKPLNEKYFKLLQAIKEQQPTDLTRLARALDIHPANVRQMALVTLYRRGLVDTEVKFLGLVKLAGGGYRRRERRVSGTIRLTGAAETLLQSSSLSGGSSNGSKEGAT